MALPRQNWYVDYGDGSTTGYYGLTQWATGATIAAGALRRQLAAPAVNSERVFVAIVAGTTHATTEPTWGTTRGAKTTDNTVTWQEATGIAALNGDLATTITWTTMKASVTPALGLIIKRNNGASYQICTTAGAVGAGEPSFSDTAGVTTADSSAVWTSLGAVGNFTAWMAPAPRAAIVSATNWAIAGDYVFLASESHETQSSALTLTSPSGSSAPSYLLCVDKLNVPPTDANQTTGASISTTGNSAITLSGGNDSITYCDGVKFSAGDGANSVSMTFGQSWNISNGYLKLGGSTGGNIVINATNFKYAVQWGNTPVEFNSTSSSITGFSDLIWRNTTSALNGSVPSSLLANTAQLFMLEGIDLSAAGSGKTIAKMATGNNANRIRLNRCKLGASVTKVATTGLPNSSDVVFTRCDNGATNYITEKYSNYGTQLTETTVVRTGGASDGTQQVSWKISTTSLASFANPFETLPIDIWNDVSGSSVTLTLFIICDSTLNTNDVWLNVEYPSDSASPQGAAVNTKPKFLAATAALTSDSSTWGGSTNKYKLVVTFTPQMKGPVTARVRIAKPSLTGLYVDPKAILS